MKILDVILHTSDFHLLLRYRQVKHTLDNASPEPTQVHTITFHSVTSPSHSVTFVNNYLSSHTLRAQDYLCSGAHIFIMPILIRRRNKVHYFFTSCPDCDSRLQTINNRHKFKMSRCPLFNKSGTFIVTYPTGNATNASEV